MSLLSSCFQMINGLYRILAYYRAYYACEFLDKKEESFWMTCRVIIWLRNHFNSLRIANAFHYYFFVLFFLTRIRYPIDTTFYRIKLNIICFPPYIMWSTSSSSSLSESLTITSSSHTILVAIVRCNWSHWLQNGSW